MNIPFYRYVDYADDGHYIYQCLNCGDKIDVGYPHFNYNPRFCSSCGIEYKGFILPKNIEWISYKREINKYVIQKGCEYKNSIDWQDWKYSRDIKNAIECLKELREYNKYDSKSMSDNKMKYYNKKNSLKWTERIIIKKEIEHSYHKIDKDKYLLKTGKKFKYENYK